MTAFPQTINASASPEVQMNENFESVALASIYGKRHPATVALTWAGYGGQFNGNAVADWTVTLTDATTNYVVALRSTGVVSVSTATTNWNSSLYARLHKITTAGGAVTATVDHRLDSNGLISTSGGTAASLDYDTDGTLAANSDAKLATQKAAKTYIDAKVAGLSWKQAVRAATTANGTLATAYANGQAIDGVTLATGDRILVKNQTTGSENGIYVVAASGAPARATDADAGAELVNASVYVSEGTTLADTQWTCTTNATITPGSTSLAFAQLTSGGGTFTGGTLTGALNLAPPVTIASGSTVAIGAAAANAVTISGTTPITAFDTIASGAERKLTFSGALTLTHNATSLILPGGANVTTAAGDVARFESLGSGNWRCTGYTRANGTALVGSGSFSGGTLTGALNEAPTVTIASSSTPAIGAAAGNSILLTGTTTVTGFDTIAAGAFRRVRFAGALLLTYNATSLILPTSANITTAADDVAEFLSLGSGNWFCTGYKRASGAALVGSSGSAGAGQVHAFRVGRSTAQSVVNATNNKAQLDTKVFDTDGVFDATTNYRFTPTVAGYYYLTGTISGNSTGTIAGLQAVLYKNGATEVLGNYYAGVSTDARAVVSGVIYLNGSTDYVELWGYMGSSGTGNYAASALAGFLISGAAAAAPHSFRAYRNTSSQAMSAAAWVKVQLNAKSFDTDTAFDATTNYRFQPAVAGYYALSGAVRTSGAASDLIAGFYKNGTRCSIGTTVGTNAQVSNFQSSSIADVVFLNGSTDYVELFAFSTSGTPTILNGDAETYFAGVLVAGAPSGSSPPSTCGRLTLTSGVPVTTSDVTGATTVYFTPFKGNVVTLWDGSAWTNYSFVETALALGTKTANLPYDVFARQVGGVLTLDDVAWTNATTRATAVTLQDGRYCKSGDKTRLYLGTYLTTSTTTTEDSGGGVTTQVGGKRFLWNYYNRVRRTVSVIDTTDSWVNTTASIVQANAAAGNKVDCVIGIAEDTVEIRVNGQVNRTVAGSIAFVGIGIDSTSVFSGRNSGGYNNAAAGVIAVLVGSYEGILTAGYHAIYWLEKGATGTTCIFYGDDGGDGTQSGLAASLFV